MEHELGFTKLCLGIFGIRTFHPITGTSTRWKHWVIVISLTGPCSRCLKKQGTIYKMEEIPSPKPPLHPHCRCHISPMTSIMCGTATKDGIQGADYLLK